ncbi:LOW QUALITY PROTEIN: uncharacterized protein LOC132947049 [Metopolophium dirhodum]|uniref:LOW QUALITY PROTEIN: uncharacterized protein LOC132947049 n=1 Tax=Metopolophium dirhodum TaxID=44670 RepID=UPI00298FD6D9|nr:LOW QUALITY PROTEIN: uncharacterized protein LOC132947049 [Metopolophium dirhodum]
MYKMYLSQTVIPVQLYHGKYKKLTSSNDYLRPFIDEMKHILSTGITINSKIFKFELVQVVCLASAKAFILNVKGHISYHRYNSCTVEGDIIHNQMAYLDMNAPLRIDEFYHKDISPLEYLPIDMSSSVVLEYMHNVCLGVMKRLLAFWVKGKKSVHLDNPEAISDELNKIKSFFPVEFNRLARTIEEFEYWKASEFRTFLIYTGPIVLKGPIKTFLYKHFMLLICAIRLLISFKTAYTYNNFAKMFLRKFVTEYSVLYGKEYVGYNVYGLIHICDFMVLHRNLNAFSAFKYENYLQFVKKVAKMLDILFRIIEQINTTSTCTIKKYPILKTEIDYDPSVNKSINETFYKEIILENFTINVSSSKDNLICTKDYGIVKIIKIIKFLNGKIKIDVMKYNTSTVFQNHISSDIIKIFYTH